MRVKARDAAKRAAEIGGGLGLVWLMVFLTDTPNGHKILEKVGGKILPDKITGFQSGEKEKGK